MSTNQIAGFWKRLAQKDKWQQHDKGDDRAAELATFI